MDNVRDRIKAFIKYKNSKNTLFEAEFGLSNGYVNNISRSIGQDLLEKISNKYPDLNIEWLLLGRGSMLKSTEKQTENVSLKSYPKPLKYDDSIPLVDISAAAGFGTLDVCIEEKNIIAKYVIPDFKGADLMIPIVGDSMEPKFTAGDIVACKILKNTNLIQWGKVYIIASRSQGFMMKRLYKSEDHDYLECQSYNPQYLPFLIEKDDISGIALVIGSVHLETVLHAI